MKTAEAQIVFLSVPESLRQHFNDSVEDFKLDPAIPIPAELPPGANSLDLERLSWEMILSGMIKVVAADPEAEDADYYRRFVLAIKPDIRSEFTAAADFKFKNDELDLALEILQALAGLFPNDPQIRLDQARSFEKRSDRETASGQNAKALASLKAAETEFQQAMSIIPAYPKAYYEAAVFYVKQQAFAKAKDCFERYAKLSQNPRRRAKAAALAKEISERGLDDDLFQLAYEAVRNGDANSGVEKIRKFLITWPEVWNAYFILGWGLRQQKQWTAAAEAFQNALRLGGENVDTHNELAICLMESKQFKAARHHLEQALRMDGDNLKIISNLGVLALRQGQKTEAAGFFRTVLDYDPNDPLAKSWLETISEKINPL